MILNVSFTHAYKNRSVGAKRVEYLLFSGVHQCVVRAFSCALWVIAILHPLCICVFGVCTAALTHTVDPSADA